jgi:hypothetical protein
VQYFECNSCHWKKRGGTSETPTFTSPPYWNDKIGILEKYNGCETNYAVFVEESLKPVIRYDEHARKYVL